MIVRRYRGLIIAVVVALLLACGGLVTLGIPGAAIFELSIPILFGVNAVDAIPSDSAWPIAIYVLLLWPVSIVLAYLIAYRALGRLRSVFKLGIALAIVIAWCLALSAFFYELA